MVHQPLAEYDLNVRLEEQSVGSIAEEVCDI